MLGPSSGMIRVVQAVLIAAIGAMLGLITYYAYIILGAVT